MDRGAPRRACRRASPISCTCAAWRLSHLGEPRRAREDAEAAFALFRVLDRRFEGARTANLLGIVAFRESDYDEAETWWRRAHELHAGLGMIKNMGGNRLNLGIAAYKRGRFHRAETELQAARRLLEQVERRASACAGPVWPWARCCACAGSRRPRAGSCSRPSEQAGELALPREEALALEYLGDVQRDEGRLDQARRYYSRALSLAASIAPGRRHRRRSACTAKGNAWGGWAVTPRPSNGCARRWGWPAAWAIASRRARSGARWRSTCWLWPIRIRPWRAIRESIRLLREVGAEHELAQIAVWWPLRPALARLESGLVGRDRRPCWTRRGEDALAALHLELRIETEAGIRRAREIVARVADRRQRLLQEPAPASRRRSRPRAGRARRRRRASSTCRR